MRALTFFAVLLCACFEVIDHTPNDACKQDYDCPCGEDCYVPDGGDLALCGPRIRLSCTQPHDCQTSDGGPNCLHLVRDGGACNYTQCQP